MTTTDRKTHWEHIYQTRPSDEVSWFQPTPALSLELIEQCNLTPEDSIVDVGGGASKLVDHLIEAGYQSITVLDIARAALEVARSRLGEAANRVDWLEADATDFQLAHQVHLWHDRAVFHFLTQANDRHAYIANVKKTLLPGGHLIIAAFAPEGPKKCSNLDIVQYDSRKISVELGHAFELQQTRQETHKTPGGADQQFNYFLFRYTPAL
ncbi:class I SAM-dependent methyltransferase [Sedimenticola selenatireducens]|uniref:SAM-dependent methyltransferase n=1 Tax=Sedimenticola selenatireducens TaxID=191960 RepID=A0A2N6D1H5_9GAMM|nr:class I SAM-dependent methyltransferase [Sedimenticola selenatireducens]PLX63557.1 MAG: SAM-dependent methyltransferase [Sedimenticola selenatireducens]